jgi:hypothetical protein
MTEQDRRRRRRLLLVCAVLAPPLAWALQLVVGYGVEEAACGRPDASLWGAGVDPLTAVVIGACGGLAIAGGVVSTVSLRQSSADDDRGVWRFVAAAGVLGSVVFLLAILLSGLALASIDGCSAG